MGKISEATLRTTLKGTENIPITDTDLPKGKTTAANLKTFVTPDLSGYATNEDLDAKADVAGDEFTGPIGSPQVTITRPSEGAMAAILANSRDIEFRTMNAGVDSMTFNVQYATPLKITEAGILENNVLLENKYAKIEDIPVVTGFITKADADGYYQPKGEYATQDEVNAKQDTLVSGTNIKTINSQSLLGQGNIEITTEGGGITDAPADGKTYGRKDSQWSEVVIPDTSDILTKTEAASTYQPKGEYLTSIPDEYVTDEELNGKGYAITSQLDAKLDTETYNSDKATFATKEELSSKANTSDLSNYLQTSVAESTYVKKSEIPEEYTLPIATAEALGGIKVGAGLSINPNTGVLNATGGGTADSVDWANITSKPEAFKPEAHQHVTADVTDLQDKLDAKADKTAIADMLTKTEASSTYQTKGNYLTTETASTTYATKAEIPSLDNYYNKTEIDDKLEDITTGGDVDLSNYYNKTESDNRYVAKEEGKVLSSNDYTNDDKAAIETIANKADKTELANKQDILVSGTNIKTVNGQTLLGNGNIAIEGQEIQVVNHGTNDTIFELTPNVLHIWDEVASLTLTLQTVEETSYNEFMIQFTSGATATQLSLPETVKWVNTPSVEANKIYQISILNNLAVLGSWDNA